MFIFIWPGPEQHQEKPRPGAECSVAQQKSSETGTIRKQRVRSSRYSVHLVFVSSISRIIGGAGVFTHSDETGPVWRGDDLLYLWSVFCVLTNDWIMRMYRVSGQTWAVRRLPSWAAHQTRWPGWRTGWSVRTSPTSGPPSPVWGELTVRRSVTYCERHVVSLALHIPHCRYPLLNTRYAEGLLQGQGQSQGPMPIQTQVRSKLWKLFKRES